MFRAVDAPLAARDEYWRQVVADTIVPMDVRLDDGPTARLATVAAGRPLLDRVDRADRAG